jgi:hypothetical protein
MSPPTCWAIDVVGVDVLWHDPSASIDYDNDRDRQIRLAGDVVERVTDTRLQASLATVVAELGALYLRRLATVCPRPAVDLLEVGVGVPPHGT